MKKRVVRKKVQKRVNKTGAEMTIGTIIIIILALVVLVVLIYGFVTGWGNLWQKVTGYGGGKANVQTNVQGCQVACSSGQKTEYCKIRDVLFEDKGVAQKLNCESLAGMSSTGLAKCDNINCLDYVTGNNGRVLTDKELETLFIAEDNTATSCSIDSNVNLNYYADSGSTNSGITAAVIDENGNFPQVVNTDNDALLTIGVNYYRNGMYQDASNTIDKVLANDPKNAYALYNKGLIIWASGNRKDSASYFIKYYNLIKAKSKVECAEAPFIKSAVEKLVNIDSIAIVTFNPNNPKANNPINITIEHICDSIDYELRMNPTTWFALQQELVNDQKGLKGNPMTTSFTPTRKGDLIMKLICHISSKKNGLDNTETVIAPMFYIENNQPQVLYLPQTKDVSFDKINTFEKIYVSE